MSRDVSGTYTLPAAYNPVVTNTPIATLWANTTLDDIATALTQSISSTGVTVPSANLPMGGFKHTGVADATLSNQYASYGQLLATSITASSVTRTVRTSNTIIAAADKAKFFDYTSGTFSQTFQAAATLGAGWYCFARNSGSGEITLDPNAAETIDSLATFVMYTNETRLIFCDGSNLFSTVITRFYKKYSTAGSYTFIWPPGYSDVESDLVAGGGGGGSGRRGAAGTVRGGGMPGGAPSRYIKNIKGIAPGTSVTVTVGAAGTGGAAISADNTNGNDGTAGGNSSFGAYAVAYGGCAGKGGSNAGGATSGSGIAAAGTSDNANGSPAGGGPNFNAFGQSSLPDNFGFGAAGMGVTTGGRTEYGGAGSSYMDVTGTTIYSSGSSIFGVSGASCGGWITAANSMPATAPTTGLNGSSSVGGGSAGGTCGASPTVGANGAAAARDDLCGEPGSGGGSSITVAAKDGGVGGGPGGPGGGGGASLNGNNSGAGGSGAAGRVILIGIA